MAEKIWFITGASRGFGRIWTEAALQRGDKVAACARNVGALADLHAAYPDALLPITLDVNDRAAVFGAVARASDHFGRLDVIVNNAGYGLLGAVEEMSEAQARAQMETNFFGALWVMQAMAPIFRRQGSGRLIGVSSLGGLMAWPTVGLYQASKFALEAVTEAFAGEMADFGVKVTLVEPGGYATDWAGDSATRTEVMPEYEGARARRSVILKGMTFGDPNNTKAAILQLVDMDQPPLRLMLGSSVLPIVRGVYERRLAEWDAFAELTASAD